MNTFRRWLQSSAFVVALLLAVPVEALNFGNDVINGSFNSTLTAGFGLRTGSQSCSLIGDPSYCGGNVNIAQYSNGDDGNLNYDAGDLFALYIKGTHELLLTMPGQGLKFMTRFNWLQDGKADDTERTPLEDMAARQVAHDVRLLDLWLSKEFSVGGNIGRVRLGNQVINWGESLFSPGGINATNALDIQKLQVPGVQLKEVVLPAPMLSLATGLGHGINVEGYYQFGWNKNRIPPVGTYFSAADVTGRGRQPLSVDLLNANVGGVDAATIGGRGLSQAAFRQLQADMVAGVYAGAPPFVIALPWADDDQPSESGQWGLSLHYHPQSIDADFGLYVLNYHDKTPVTRSLATGALQSVFLEDRMLYGVSSNFQLGDWAVGTELSYRPRDAVALTPCFVPGAPLDANFNQVLGIDCDQWMDRKKTQFHLTGLYSMTQGNAGPLLDLLHADAAGVAAELVWAHYFGVSEGRHYTRDMNGVTISQVPYAAYAFWLDNSTLSTLGYPITGSGGTADTVAMTVDFNWTYDGTLVPGWQVIPGVTFSATLTGDLPTVAAQYLDGAKSANIYLNFNQNPVKWQAGLNYTLYWGGDAIRQPLADRDFLGGFVAFSF